MRKWKMSVVLLVILMVAVSWSAVAAPEVGDMIPDFTVKDLQGKDVKISDLRGEYVLLDIWATWCPPCKKAIQAYKENLQEFEKAGIKIVALSVDAKFEDLTKYMEKDTLPFTVLHDANKGAKEFLGVRAIPTLFFLSPEGKILVKEIGFADFADLWDQLIRTSGKTSNVDYPVLKYDTYNLKSTKVDYAELFKNISNSFVDSGEKSFNDKPVTKLTKEPQYPNTPVYSEITISGQMYVMAGVDSAKTGFMDLLYVDFNQNLDLTDDKPLKLEKFSNYTEIVFPLEVKKTKGLYNVTVYSYNGENNWYMENLNGFEGMVEAEGKKIKVLLLDGNVNGKYDDPEDVLLLDNNGNGVFDSFSTIIEWTRLGTFKLGKNTYTFKVIGGGKVLVLDKVK